MAEGQLADGYLTERQQLDAPAPGPRRSHSSFDPDKQQALRNSWRSSSRPALAVQRRDSIVDERMRQADMLELHRRAMRRMQSNAEGLA